MNCGHRRWLLNCKQEETEDGKTVVIHSMFPMDGGESDHIG